MERADYIEKNPELFADGEKFRIFHAEARFNSVIFTGISYLAAVGALEMFMPQLQAKKMLMKYPAVKYGALVAYAMITY